MEVLKEYGAAILSFGLIYFIAIRLFKNQNCMRKALFTFIIGFVLTLLFVIGTIYDYNNITILPNFSFFEKYYAFLIVSVLMMIIIPGIYLLLGKSRHQRFKSFQYKIKKQKEKVVPTIKDYKGVVYLIFKNENNFLLENKKDLYCGIIRNLNSNILFHDEMVKQIINEYEIKEDNPNNVIDIKLCGEVKTSTKKDLHYFCYTVDIKNIPESLKEFKSINPYELVNYNLDDLNKQILYHMILRDYFDIKL